MRRFVPLFLGVLVTSFGLSTARGEFDLSGSQAGPGQVQANRPPQAQNLDYAKLLKLIGNGAPAGTVIIDVSGDAIVMKLVAGPPVRPVKPKPGPPRKPPVRPRRTPLLDPAKYISSGDW